MIINNDKKGGWGGLHSPVAEIFSVPVHRVANGQFASEKCTETSIKVNPPRILLVNPWIYDFAAYDSWMKPLGLLYIAGVLRENGCEVFYLDCLHTRNHQAMCNSGIRKAGNKKCGSGHFYKENIDKPECLTTIPRRYSRYGITPELFERELRGHPKPDVIVVTSMMTYWYPGVFHTIRLLRKFFPGVPVILGGIYATLCPSHALSSAGADFCISGEGEATVLKKVVQLTGHAISCPPDLSNLDSLPYPAFDLLLEDDALCLLTARGCPYSCGYCASSLLQDSVRQRSPQKVFDEVSYWIDHCKVEHFAFYDDALLYRAEERIMPLLKKIIAGNCNCSFHAPNGLHASAITEELAALLFAAGVKTIRIGFETADERRQRETGAKTTNRDFRRAVKNLRKAGYREDEIGVYLLAGLPGQRAEEIRRSITFVRDCGARPLLAEYSPIPGTALWESALCHSPFDLAQEPLYHNNSVLPCRSGGLGWEELYELKNEIRHNRLYE